ncbi:MAG: COX15/CtaA family protein [Deltaproteobacteria bacterium]|nr:COX15/CtaA family protein [Deltaproteobacteria bacterium]
MKKLLQLDIIFTFILMVWGGVVRSAGAGLACPDWPLCHGRFLPPIRVDIVLEMTHRLLASLVVFLTLALLILIVRDNNLKEKYLKLVVSAFILLIAQAVLGGVTVLAGTPHYFVTFHLGVALIFFSLLLSMWLRLSNPSVIPAKAGIQTFTILLLLLIYIQILVGGVVASSHAGLICGPEFPKCLGVWVPHFFDYRIVFHFLHRILAYVVFIFVVGFTIYGFKQAIPSKLKSALFGILGITLFQLALGIGNVMFALPYAVRVLHLAFAIGLFTMVYVMLYKLRFTMSS